MPNDQTPEDLAREREVAEILARAWDNATAVKFAGHAEIDWYFKREEKDENDRKYERPVGFGEVKCRKCTHDKYETVYFAMRKWLALLLAQVGMGLPSVFIVRWSDGETRFIRVRDVDASRVEIRGRDDRGYENDMEPCILVPIKSMTVIK